MNKDLYLSPVLSQPNCTLMHKKLISYDRTSSPDMVCRNLTDHQPFKDNKRNKQAIVLLQQVVRTVNRGAFFGF